jgi:hypothetical protein
MFLDPENPEFQAIEITMEDEGSISIVAELVEVLGLS